MKKWFLAIGGAGVAAVLLGVFAATAIVFAQTPPTTPTPRQQAITSFLDKVAKNLGIDRARLEAAIKQASLDTIDEKQRAGQLTPEQAQRAKDRVNQGQLGFPFGLFGGHGKDGAGIRGLGVERAEAARIIGITEDQLRSELQSGKSLAEVAAAHNVSRDTLVKGLTDAANKRIDDALANKRITQDQANQLKARVPDMINRLVDAKPGQGGGFPGWRGHGG